VSTSSLPHQTQSPLPIEVRRIVDGQQRRMDVSEIQQRSEYDFTSPMA